MRKFRTASPNGSGLQVVACLLALALVKISMPVLAQDEVPAGEAPETSDRPSEAAPPSARSVRGVVSSGLGEWGLSQRFPGAVLWLELAEEARSLALFRPEQDAPARGAVMILADEGENAESGMAGALARELAQRRLAVLSLGLEAPPAALEAVLERPVAGGETSQNADTAATIDVMAESSRSDLEAAYRQRIQAELLAGASALGEREYELVAVVGVGRGSNHVVAYAAEQSPAAALIWITPEFYPRDAERLVTNLQNAGGPRVLELATGAGPSQRKATLQRAGVEGVSRQVVGPAGGFVPQGAKALAGRISAWLKTSAGQ